MADHIGKLLGNYHIIRLLGRGGYSDVYLGEHVYLKTQAAIKVLRTQLTDDDLQDFLNEARIVASLKHPHVVRVLEFGVEKLENDSSIYLVMDYAPNGTLRQKFPKGARLPLTNIPHYVQQIAEALQYAHDRKLIHRDVKPENMLLGRNNEVLLSDFGVAIVSQNSLSLNTREVVGTLAYIAPEQLQGKPRPASDQYALGIVVYEWLTGDRPFYGSYMEVATQHMLVPPPPLREKVPSIPPAVEEVVLKVLEKEPNKRFSSVLAFAEALEQACQPTEPQPLDYSIIKSLTNKPVVSSPVEESLTPTVAAAPLSEESLAAFDESLISLSAFPTISRPFTPSFLPPPSYQLQGGPSTSSSTDKTTPTEAPDQSAGASSLLPPIPPSPEQTFATASLSQQTQSTFATQSMEVINSSQSPAISLEVGKPVTIYSGHSDWVRAVAWSPDGKQIASASNDKTVQVWNAVTGNRVSICRGHSGAVYAVTWSPDGKQIASASADKTVLIWDAALGRNILTCRGHTGEIYAVEWSPDGKYVSSAAADRTARIWNAATGSRAVPCSSHNDWVRGVSWSPDGSRIATVSNDKTIQVWDARTGQRIFTLSGHNDWVRGVSWSPDGKYITSASNDKTVQVWDAATRYKVFTYYGHYDCWLGGVLTVMWSPSGLLIASGGEDQTVQLWKVPSGENVFTYSDHSAPVDAVAWSPDGKRIASAGYDKTVRVWRVL